MTLMCYCIIVFCDLQLLLLGIQNYPLCCRCHEWHCSHILFKFGWPTCCCN